MSLAYLDHPMQRDNIGSTPQIFQNLDFSLYFLLFDWFESLDDTFLVVGYINALKDLTVFASPKLPDKLKIILKINTLFLLQSLDKPKLT